MRIGHTLSCTLCDVVPAQAANTWRRSVCVLTAVSVNVGGVLHCVHDDHQKLPSLNSAMKLWAIDSAAASLSALGNTVFQAVVMEPYSR